MSRRKNNQDINVLLPETVITPNGSYTQFTGGEGFIPSLDYFKELEINKDRVNAVNKMLALEAPVDPHNPSMSYPSAALGVFGMSDDTRNYIFGNDNKRRTCLYTASSQYNDTPVASNRQFAANPEKYGFKEVDVKNAGIGDIVQFWENGKVPHHATVYTGNTPEGEPLISYSNGNTEAYREWKYPNGEYEVRGNIIKNRNISDGPVQDLGTQHYYRYIGSPQKHEQIERRYEMLKNGEHIYKNGGFLHPKDAWDELSLADKAKMMEVAVRNGITNLQEIRKKYNEFADGGNFNSLPDNWTMEDESAYRQWLSSLPDNLKSTDDSVYDMRRAFKAGMVPVLNEDGYYHLGSRDPQTGRILKAPIHPTYLQAITEDARMGYYPTINDKGVTYTNTWKGNQFKGGGYTSSDSIRSRIAKYEGKAMTGAIDPLSGKWDKNRSFEAEDASFYDALPKSIRAKVLANPDFADNLYSYSYNVGAGNFKKRVVPTLEKYYQGKATVGDIERSMWASGDAKLRGLRRRREEERAGVRKALDPTKPIIAKPDNIVVFNPYIPQQQNTIQLPQYVPVEDEYVRTVEVSPEQQRAIQLQERFDQINRFSQLMKLAGIENTAIPAFMPETGVTMLDDVWNTGEYAKGGRIHIKPENRGKFTALKKRTGKSASWFKAHGTPAQKKMATFALNARKWKHADGGHLYEDGGVINPYNEPQTFIGRIAQVVGSSPSVVRGADVVSSAVQMTPYGNYIAAMDLGRDLNRAYHNEDGAWWDSALDAASMLPFLRQSGLKAGKTLFNTIRNNKSLRRAINAGIGLGKAIDFISDTYGANKASKAEGGYLHGPLVEAANMYYPGGPITLGPRYYMYNKNGQMMRYPDGSPMIQVNASAFPDITIIPDSQKSPADRNEDERFRARTQKDYDEHKQGEWTAQQANSWKKSYNKSGAKKVEDFFKGEQRDKQEKPTYFSAFDGSLQPYGQFFGALAHGLQLLSPSQHVGAAADAIQGKRGYFDSLFNGNSGFFTDQYAAKHPLVSLYGNMVGDAAAGIGAFKGYNAGKQFVQNNYTGTFGKPVVPENYSTVSPTIRTKVGDVEINNPELLYHLDGGDGVGAFSNQGAYVQDGILYPGIPKETSATPYSWWNLGKPYAAKKKGEPLQRLMTTTADDTPSMLHVRSQNYPIGQWNGKRGFVTNSEYVSSEPVNVANATYTYDPNYGYRRAFQEGTPAAEWAQFTENANYSKNNINNSKGNTLSITDAPENTTSFTEEDVIKELPIAEEYKKSSDYKKLITRARRESRKLGIGDFSPSLFKYKERQLPSISFNEELDPEMLASYNKVTNNINIDINKNLRPGVPVHEGYHWQRVGEPDIEGTKQYKELLEQLESGTTKEERDVLDAKYHTSEEGISNDNAQQYLEQKVKDALYEDYPDDGYLRKQGELVVNGKEAGEAVGVKSFEKYPGYEKAKEIIEKARKYNEELWHVKGDTRRDARRFWKILSGNYHPAAIPTIVTFGAGIKAASNTESNNNN